MSTPLPTLHSNTLCVVLCDLRRCRREDLEHHRALLSAAERQKNAALGHPALRDRDTNCRGLLRRHLALLLDAPAKALTLQTTGKGKPVLANAHKSLHFNLSHSGNYAAIAFHKTAPVGIDIERIDAAREPLRLSQRFFSAEESLALAALEEQDRLRQFYRLWTLKEAYIKTRGDSIFDGLRAPGFDVATQQNDAGPHEERHWRDISNEEGWQFWSYLHDNEYQLAVASRRSKNPPGSGNQSLSPEVIASPLLS